MLALAILAYAFVAGAQSAPPVDGVFINWSTSTYVPPGYQGKRLPTSGSDVSAWIAIFSNGKPANASAYAIRWYIDNKVFQSGKGLNTISFKTPKATSQIINLQARAQAPDGEVLVGNIQVPVVNPVVAIRADYPNGIFTQPSANVAALPYFFNVPSLSSLTFQWSANSVSANNEENPDAAVINLGDNAKTGTKIRVQVTVTDSSNSTAASAYTNLVYQKP